MPQKSAKIIKIVTDFNHSSLEKKLLFTEKKNRTGPIKAKRKVMGIERKADLAIYLKVFSIVIFLSFKVSKRSIL